MVGLNKHMGVNDYSKELIVLYKYGISSIYKNSKRKYID